MRFIAVRIGLAAMISIIVATLIFFGVHILPGDLALQVASSRFAGTAPDPALANGLRQELGLDRPLIQQYGAWIAQLVQLDLGNSLVTGRPVAEELAPYFRRTLILGTSGLVGAILIAVPFGYTAGRHPGSLIDQVTAFYCSLVAAMPGFLIGVLLIQFVVLQLNIGSISGETSVSRIVLPALVVALGLSAGLLRIVRNAVREVSGTDFFDFAGMRGVPDNLIFARHGVRNALLPVMGYLSTVFVFLVYDIVVVEVVFNYPGIGLALYQSVLARDLPMLQAAALILVLTYLVVTCVFDAAAMWLDPRTRREFI